ncbi:hypothetical protein [Streptomyces sp. NPDC058272]|uniref:hypothetical protein n=1 Tax=Streptomyces sp. NPDC058272 TaxID=3346415 RepID=UPI0036EFB805
MSINGVDVGRMSKPPKIVVGHDRAVTTVTITLVPSVLTIKGELSDGDRREPRAGFAAKID